MKKYEELLMTERGRGQLQDLLGERLRLLNPRLIDEEAAIPVARVVSCADHRNDGGRALEEMKQGQKKPIEVREAWVGKHVYYLVHDGNHRAEAARALGHETIKAQIYQRVWLQERDQQREVDAGLER